MPFITTKSGQRFNVDRIVEYRHGHQEQTQIYTDCLSTHRYVVEDTPEELDALIRTALLEEEYALQQARLRAETDLWNESNPS